MTRARMPRPHEVAAARRDPRLLRALAERSDDSAWRTRGLCNSVDPETFFPAPSEPADTALDLCRSCAVQGSCLAWALDFGDCHGVWGATTPRERRAMLVAWRAEHGQSEIGTTAVPIQLISKASALAGPHRDAGPRPALGTPLASIERIPHQRRVYTADAMAAPLPVSASA